MKKIKEKVMGQNIEKSNINWYPRTYGKNKKANHRRLKAN